LLQITREVGEKFGQQIRNMQRIGRTFAVLFN